MFFALTRLAAAPEYHGEQKVAAITDQGGVYYQWTRNQTATNLPGIVPTEDERGGNLAGLMNALGHPIAVHNPATGLPFTGNTVPVSLQAQALAPRVLRHSRTATTTDVYMQELPERVRATVNSIHQELTRKGGGTGDGGPEPPKPSAKRGKILSFSTKKPVQQIVQEKGGSETVFAGR